MHNPYSNDEWFRQIDKTITSNPIFPETMKMCRENTLDTLYTLGKAARKSIKDFLQVDPHLDNFSDQYASARMIELAIDTEIRRRADIIPIELVVQWINNGNSISDFTV